MSSTTALLSFSVAEVALASFVLGVVAGFARYVYVRWTVAQHDRSLTEFISDLRTEVSQLRGEAAQEASTQLERVHAEGRTFYESVRDTTLLRAMYSSIGLCLALTLVFLCLGAALSSAEHGSVWIMLTPIPAVLLAYSGFVYWPRWGHSDNRKAEYVWLYLVLPHGMRSKTLDIAAGTLNPDPSNGYGLSWFFPALAFLRRKHGVALRILAGKPDFSGLEEGLRRTDAETQWNQVRHSITENGLQDTLLLTSDRPMPEFSVCRGLVRLEEDHPSWTERPRDALVQNHIFLFNRPLERTMGALFDRMWRKAESRGPLASQTREVQSP